MRDQFQKYQPTLPPLTEREIELYCQYDLLLREWNTRINLISRKSIDSVFAFHISDSLWILHLTQPFIEGRKIIDVGTGGGFPGLIGSIRYPDQEWFLYESIAKKRKFLAAVIHELKLKNVGIGERFEGTRDVSFLYSRAVFPKETVISTLYKLVPVKSRATICLGSHTPSFNVSPFQLVSNYHYELPESAGGRQLRIVEKVD